MRSPLCLFVGMLCIVLPAWAQTPSPVRLEVHPRSLQGSAGDTVTVTVRMHLAAGWYTYGLKAQLNDEGIGPEPLQLSLSPSSLWQPAGTIRAPQPQRKYDEGFSMEVEYYTGSATFHIPARLRASEPGRYTGYVTIVYQVCDSTRCLPPEEVRLPVRVVVIASSGEKALEAVSSATTEPSVPATPPTFTGRNVQNPRPTTMNMATPEDIWPLLGIAAGAAAFALLTPCVFPMIPITVSFFTKQAERNRRRVLRNALLYALGIMTTFVGLGFLLSLLFGATGIQEFATNPWVNLLIAALFIAFALNLFGAYELILPAKLLNYLHRISEQQSITGVLLMGLTFSLSSFTCTVPFVGTALVAIASGKWFYPLIGMTVFAAVFAAPFFLLSLFPAALTALPRAGTWMNNLKVVMGLLELAAAVKFLSNADLVWGWGILSRELFLASWVFCGALITLYVLGLFRLPHDTPVEHVGPVRILVAVAFGTLTLWLATGLWDKPLGELDAYLPPRDYYELLDKGNAVARSEVSSASLTWYESLEPAFAEARRLHKLIFIDFTGFTCTNCRWMETNMFSKPQVQQLLAQMVRARLFTDRRTEPYLSHKRFQQEHFGTVELPFYAILRPDTTVIATAGFTRDMDTFVSFLRNALSTSSASLP